MQGGLGNGEGELCTEVGSWQAVVVSWVSASSCFAELESEYVTRGAVTSDNAVRLHGAEVTSRAATLTQHGVAQPLSL